MADTPKKPTDKDVLEEMERDTDAGAIAEEEREDRVGDDEISVAAAKRP